MKIKYMTVLVMTVLLMTLASAAISGSETITRTVPTANVAPGSTFSVSYTANGVSGSWGATLTESISGGCMIDGKTSLQFAMLSDLPNPLVYTATAPSSNAVCTFTGDYKFGDLAIVPLAGSTVNVVTGACTPTWTCGTWGTCSNSTGTPIQTRTCTDSTCSNPTRTETQACTIGGTSGWCSIASKLAFFKVMDDPCIEGSLVLAGIGVILLLLFKG